MSNLHGANVVIVDAEVLHSPDDLPTGWQDKKALGLSIGGYWDYLEGRVHWFDRWTLVRTMMDLVERQPLLVSFNGLQFDFALMRALVRSDADGLKAGARPGEMHPGDGRAECANLHVLCDAFKALAAQGYDLLQEVWREAGGRSHTTRGMNSLNALCRANGLGQKTGHGAEAPRLWQQGRIAEVVNYCQQDILLTKALFELALANHGTIQRRDGPVTLALPVLPEPQP